MILYKIVSQRFDINSYHVVVLVVNFLLNNFYQELAKCTKYLIYFDSYWPPNFVGFFFRKYLS